MANPLPSAWLFVSIVYSQNIIEKKLQIMFDFCLRAHIEALNIQLNWFIKIRSIISLHALNMIFARKSRCSLLFQTSKQTKCNGYDNCHIKFVTNNWNGMCHPIVHIHKTQFSLCWMVRALAFVFIDFRQGHNYWRLWSKSFHLHNFLCRLFSTVIPKNDVSKTLVLHFTLFCICFCLEQLCLQLCIVLQVNLRAMNHFKMVLCVWKMHLTLNHGNI